jgi:glycosyltransferase involved in cell wall biosynthesis
MRSLPRCRSAGDRAVRVGIVVQRYGPDIAGGSEQAARSLAVGLAARGHDVEVITSCARDYLSWANEFDAGVADIEGVTVRRIPVRRPRNGALFGHLSGRVMSGRSPAPLSIQRAWRAEQGPDLNGYPDLLDDWIEGRDVVVFVTYLYATTTLGVERVAGRVPTVLMSTLHDEPPARLDIIRPAITSVDAVVALTEEEYELVTTRFRGPEVSVIGLPIEWDGALPVDGEALLARLGVTRPFVLGLGRLDANKGAGALVAWWQRLRSAWPQAPALVLAGDPAPLREFQPPLNLDGVTVLGIVDDDIKRALLMEALCLLQLSQQESFSIVVGEAWLAGCPVIVRSNSPVLAGQVARSGGGIAVSTPDELDAAVLVLLEDPVLRSELAGRGRQYVLQRYSAESVIDQWERLLASVVASNSVAGAHQ